MTFHYQTRPGFDLTGADVGDAVDCGKATRTVAGQTETSSDAGMLVVAQQRRQDGVVGTEADGLTVE